MLYLVMIFENFCIRFVEVVRYHESEDVPDY